MIPFITVTQKLHVVNIGSEKSIQDMEKNECKHTPNEKKMLTKMIFVSSFDNIVELLLHRS